jgi:hypothetical protein
MIKKIEKPAILENFQRLSSRESSNLSLTTQNSFLVEIENNVDIDETIRSEINKRFNRSLVNATYKFPRVSHSPFPSISLQQKCSQRENVRGQHKKFVKIFRIVSHTPKPSLNQSLNVTNKLKIRNLEQDRKVVSITPTPLSFAGKNKKVYDFPKIKKQGRRSPYLSLKN